MKHPYAKTALVFATFIVAWLLFQSVYRLGYSQGHLDAVIELAQESTP